MLSFVDLVLAQYWNWTGRRSFRLGYMSSRRRTTVAYLNSGKFAKEDWTRYGVDLDERIIEYPWVLGKLGVQAGCVLDAGSSLNFDYLLARPELASKQLFISTLAPELRAYPHLGVSYVFEDLRKSCYRDGYFDVVVCVSTLEHVGLDNTLLYTSDSALKEFAPDSCLEVISEFRRMLKPGGRLMITVPYGVHAVRGWYQVFDAAMINSVVERFHPSAVTAEYFLYAADGWRRASADECAEADTHDPHRPHEPAADAPASSRAVCCLVLTTDG